jgi:aspartokinase/homoserine dehydrogenase 1
LVEQVQTIKQLSFNEALELSHFGAKVLYPKSIKPLRDFQIPLYLKNTFFPNETGTMVSNKNENVDDKIKGISSLNNITMLTFSGACLAGKKGMASKIFKALEVVNIILITQSSSEQDICVAINSAEKEQALEAINRVFEREIALGELDAVDVENELSIIAIVGDHMKKQHGLSGEAFSVLGENGINIKAIAQGSTERNISLVIQQSDERKALNVLHEKFFRQTTKKVHLFIAGMGNVGQEFLSILNKQKQYLHDHFRLDIKIIGLARSNGYYWDEEGIDTNSLPKLNAGNFADFVSEVTTTNLRNAVFIDNSASEEVSALYLPFLQHNMSLVTCNKIASASAADNYKKLRKTAHQNHVHYMHETCVGAALPIIKTIQHIVLSGDKVTKIQACLSGSLSFIFNNYDGSKPFVDIVKQAMAEGYTEPNPYIDLSGLDVKRKILILARESGFDMELTQVATKSFLPDGADEAKTVEEFLQLLAVNENHFKNLFDQANSKNNRLKVVATFEDGNASVGLEEIAPDHPFYYVEGKDNIISINSERYPEQPMIIKGAGAGAVVTASGVFSDLMLVINR